PVLAEDEQHSCHRGRSDRRAAVLARLVAVRVVSMEPAVLAGWAAPPPTRRSAPALDQRQPIFNVPGVVLVLLVSFAAVHLLRWALPVEDGAWLTAALAFIPARER